MSGPTTKCGSSATTENGFAASAPLLNRKNPCGCPLRFAMTLPNEYGPQVSPQPVWFASRTLSSARFVAVAFSACVTICPSALTVSVPGKVAELPAGGVNVTCTMQYSDALLGCTVPQLLLVTA